MNLTEFNLNQYEKICFFGIDERLENSFSCDDMLIRFEGKNIKLILYENFVFEGVDPFFLLLNKVINNQAKLHKSINEDIGYLWNKYLQADEYECRELVKEGVFWVGQDNLLWSPTGNKKGVCTTWLYNNQDGEIILEITPSYRWHFFDPQEGDEYISYEEFMQNYKPILFRTIPKEVAKNWLKQVEQLSVQIATNEAKATLENRRE